MKKCLNKIKNIIEKIGKHNFVLIVFIFVALITTSLFQTFSLYTTSVGESIVDGIKTYSFILNNNDNTSEVTIAANNSKNVDITIFNDSDALLKYGLYYSTESPDIYIGYSSTTKTLPNGTIEANSDYVVTVKIDNLSDEDITINFGVKYGFENGGELGLEDTQYWLEEYVPTSKVNRPNLDNGNLIPVYYDDLTETWKKADHTNLNNTWYDYEKKMWANAVIIDPNMVTDLSPNKNNGKIVGASWDKEAGVVSTDGVDDYINLGLASYNFGTSFSMVTRIKFDALNSTTTYVSVFSNLESGGFGLCLDASDQLAVRVYNSSSSAYVNAISSVVPVVGQWYTIAVTYDGTIVTLYVDGVSVATVSLNKAIKAIDEPFLIAGNPAVSSGTLTVTQPLMVTVSDALIFSRTLSTDEVSNNYSNKIKLSDDTGLLVYCDFSTDFDYDKAPINTTIFEDDILAYYVWIPRFKYRVWNITRQAGVESTYAYPAFTDGIEIVFEQGTSSTGNVECLYNISTTEAATALSDVCVVNGTDTITTTSGNGNYRDAWYTHPAFTFGTDPIEGFWVGKFEISTVTDSACYNSPSSTNCNKATLDPRILPDVKALDYQTISNKFVTAAKLQNYLSNNSISHMMTSLEWGAVTYLTHSKYGLCNEFSCNGIYINNSSSHFTGRSGGAIAGSADLALKTVYSGSTTSTTKYNANGYYDYKGHFIDYSGNVTDTKDITKVASTTRNVTGVYDMSGGSYEFLMGNMVTSAGVFYPSSSGTAWNTSVDGYDSTIWYDSTNSVLDSKYYDIYSYGTKHNTQAGYNRAHLGDATAEVLGGVGTDQSWHPGSAITGQVSFIVYYNSSYKYPWFTRSGDHSLATSGLFYFDRRAGGAAASYSSRSTIS